MTDGMFLNSDSFTAYTLCTFTDNYTHIGC